MISEAPRATPVTSPLVGLMVATAGVLLLHVPAGLTSLREIVEPTQADEGPVMAAGEAVTVSVADTVQPVPRE